jgi:hypothetical protein
MGMAVVVVGCVTIVGVKEVSASLQKLNQPHRTALPFLQDLLDSYRRSHRSETSLPDLIFALHHRNRRCLSSEHDAGPHRDEDDSSFRLFSSHGRRGRNVSRYL